MIDQKKKKKDKSYYLGKILAQSLQLSVLLCLLINLSEIGPKFPFRFSGP
jgi:hypothetical protein